MSTWFSAQRLIKIGPSLILGATLIALSLMVVDRSVGDISSILIVAIPISILIVLFGFVVTLAGAVAWAFQSSTQKLARYGIALMGLAIICFLGIDKIKFGFDDPRILFAQAIAGTPLIVGVLFLLFAGIRRVRVAFTRWSK
jgi:hypothetical protein